jgi:hypothetical protein
MYAQKYLPTRADILDADYARLAIQLAQLVYQA